VANAGGIEPFVKQAQSGLAVVLGVMPPAYL